MLLGLFFYSWRIRFFEVKFTENKDITWNGLIDELTMQPSGNGFRFTQDIVQALFSQNSPDFDRIIYTLSNLKVGSTAN